MNRPRRAQLVISASAAGLLILGVTGCQSGTAEQAAGIQEAVGAVLGPAQASEGTVEEIPESDPSPAPAVTRAVADLSDESAGGADDGEWIAPLAEGIRALGAGRGFCTIETDYASLGLLVRWSGEVPEDVRDLVARSKHAVTFQTSSRYSRDQVDAAAQQLFTSPELQQLDLVGLDPWLDCSGITVKLAGGTPPSSTVRRALQERAGVSAIDFQLNSPTAVGYIGA